jgi:hypothetical protein
LGAGVFLQVVEECSSSSSTAAARLRGLLYFRGPILTVEPWGALKIAAFAITLLRRSMTAGILLHRSPLLLHAGIPSPDLLDREASTPEAPFL